LYIQIFIINQQSFFMNYVITGGAGNISKPLALALLAAGHQVTVIGRTEKNLDSLTAAGAKAAIGSVEDAGFLAQAFAGADAVYTMVPPNHNPIAWKNWIGSIGEHYAAAIRANKIKYVVNLSSVGADLPDGCGPVSGLHKAELALNTLVDTAILHLRPSYFYPNLLANIGLIKAAGIMGSNFELPEGRFPIVAPSDIAAVAADALQHLHFSGHTVQYIASDETGTAEIAAVIGKAIDKPELPWVKFTDEQSYQGMLQAGLSEEVVRNYVEMGAALQNGSMLADYWKHRPAQLGKVKLADFAKTFAAAYQS
jgi:uncharacterized protein YbjT (DUF2867 family)